MKYIIYKITNNLNGKIYIGKHQTFDVNDGYMGSGKLIRRAIRKYGIDNFSKELLFIYETEQEMNDKEAEIVTEEFIAENDTYNLCSGGQGGFSYINRNGLGVTENQKSAARKYAYRNLEVLNAPENIQSKRAIMAKVNQIRLDKNIIPFRGKKHTAETIAKMKESSKGKSTGNKNSQYGTMWITDGISNKKIIKTETIPMGWDRGRVLK